MRLWHKDLIPALPRKQLIGQWRECCLIAKNIVEKGKPNHLLVNRIMDYPQDEFNSYADAVFKELIKRGYKANRWSFFKWRNDINTTLLSVAFRGWHNDRYLR